MEVSDHKDDELFYKLGQILDEYQWLVGKADCIQGVGIGYKYINEEATDQLALIFFVRQKIPIQYLPISDVIPSKITIPDPEERGKPLEIITDIEESGEIRFQNHAPLHRPVHGGEQIHAMGQNGYGTLGCIVQDMTITSRKEMVLLSNEHVLGPTAGVDTFSPLPRGLGNEQVGQVRRGIQIHVSRFARNTVDAAIAAVDVDMSFDIHDIGGITGTYLASGNDTRKGGLAVQKYGARTHHTTGNIRAVRTILIAKGKSGFKTRKARFLRQIVVRGSNGSAFSNHGDSGSVGMTMDGKVFGLLFAGGRGFSFLNPIQAVEHALQVKVVAGSGTFHP